MRDVRVTQFLVEQTTGNRLEEGVKGRDNEVNIQCPGDNQI